MRDGITEAWKWIGRPFFFARKRPSRNRLGDQPIFDHSRKRLVGHSITSVYIPPILMIVQANSNIAAPTTIPDAREGPCIQEASK